MMPRIRLVAAVFLVLGFVSAGTAFARPPFCEEQCTPSTPDYIVCTCERAGLPVTTCGSWREDMCGLLVQPPADEETEATDAVGAVIDAQAADAAAGADDAVCWAAPERA